MTNFSPFGGSREAGQNFSLFLSRIVLGFLFFMAGWSKLNNPNWSAAGYISGSKIFVNFYSGLLQPTILPIVNFLNEWGLTLIGLALILGIFVRVASFFGIIMMTLYYLPIYPPKNGLIDEHIILISAFLILISFGAGKILTLNTWVQTRLHPAWHKWID